MLIDTHCHLFYDNFKDDLDEVINRAVENEVSYIIVPATDIDSSIKTIELIEKYPNIYGAVGVHPLDARNWNDQMLNRVDELAKHPKIVAIGEIGLDYFHDYTPQNTQLLAFREQLDLAVSNDLPVIIHNRDSSEDMMDIIRTYYGTNLRGQFHCFNGSVDDAIELQNNGFFISFTGSITFTNAVNLRDLVKQLDVNKMLVETDSPFMAPVPLRGKRNEPSNVKAVAEKLAEIFNVSYDDICNITNNNAFNLFGLAAKTNTDFTYKLSNSLYINITNRCNAACTFCNRAGDAALHGYNLKMEKKNEPSAELYISEIGDPKQYKEVVFCGYGEPTIRWDVVKDIAEYVKANGGSTRMNTNGHGNIINKRDITPELKGLIDVVSISLNAIDAKHYSELMQVKESFYYEMLNFAKNAKDFSHVVLSIVDLESIDHPKAKSIADSLGVDFRIRPYF